MMPDGFRLEISTDGTTGATWQDVGVISAGADVTFNWTDLSIDAGNYEGLEDLAIDQVVAVAPSPLWNWDPAVIAAVFPGFLAVNAATDPGVGYDITYAGTSNHVTLTRCKIRMTHYTVDATAGSETDDDIEWRFTLDNAKIDAGGTFNLKGVNEDGLNEIQVSFTGVPDSESSYQLMTFFKAS